jgi:hypothetical protein
MKDPEDGGVLFCCAKRYTAGMLLSGDQIQSWINGRTQKKKNDKGKPTRKYIEEDRLIEATRND